MNVRRLICAVLASVAVSTAFAEEPKRTLAEPKPEAREQTLLDEVAIGMREILRAVTPQISLPALELKLPTLDGRAR